MPPLITPLPSKGNRTGKGSKFSGASESGRRTGKELTVKFNAIGKRFTWSQNQRQDNLCALKPFF